MNFSKRKAEKKKEELREIARREGNKFCFECNQRGPLYVVFPFAIFVCSTCAAVHRSFQHKVKGISMCEFTDDELARLRVGGNDRAFLIWIGNDENAIKSNKFNMDCSNVLLEGMVYSFIESVFQCKKYFNASEWEKFEDDAAAGSNSSVPSVKQSNILKNSFSNKCSSSSYFSLISPDTHKTKPSVALHNTSSSNVHNTCITAENSTTEINEERATNGKEKGNKENNKFENDLFVNNNAKQIKILEDMFAPSPIAIKLTHEDSTQAPIKESSASQMQSLTNEQENETSINNNSNKNNDKSTATTTQTVLDDLFANASPEVPTTTTTTTTTASPPTSTQNFIDYFNSNNLNETNIKHSNNEYNNNANNLLGSVETKELFPSNDYTNMWNFSNKTNNNNSNNNNNNINYNINNNDNNRSVTNNLTTNVLPQTNFTGGYSVPQQSNSLHHVNFLQEPLPPPLSSQPPQWEQQQQCYQTTTTMYDPLQQASMVPMPFQSNNFYSSNISGQHTTTNGGGNNSINNNIFDFTGRSQQQQRQQQQQEQISKLTQEGNANAFASLNPFINL